MGTKVKPKKSFLVIHKKKKEGENLLEKKALKEAFIRSFLALNKWKTKDEKEWQLVQAIKKQEKKEKNFWEKLKFWEKKKP